MKNVRTTCDKCREQIEAGGSVLTVAFGALAARLHEPLDLCPQCSGAFVEWLSQPLPKPSKGQ